MRRCRPEGWHALLACIVAVLVGAALVLAPVHHAIAGAASANYPAVGFHGSGEADLPCAPDHRAGGEKQPLACGAAAGGCVLALSPLPDPVPSTARTAAAAPVTVGGFVGWDRSPALPPPRPLDA